MFIDTCERILDVPGVSLGFFVLVVLRRWEGDDACEIRAGMNTCSSSVDAKYLSIPVSYLLHRCEKTGCGEFWCVWCFKWEVDK